MTRLHNIETPIFHRDIKSGNILIRKDGTCCLTDFGWAKISQNSSQLSSSNGNVGTLAWRAPELSDGSNKYTSSCDVYSFGILMYEIFRKLPFEQREDNRPKILTEKECPSLKDTPNLLIPLMKECWNDNPLQRPTFSIITQRLIAISEGKTASHHHPPSVPLSPPHLMIDNSIKSQTSSGFLFYFLSN